MHQIFITKIKKEEKIADFCKKNSLTFHEINIFFFSEL